jgi:hypothetical protein
LPLAARALLHAASSLAVTFDDHRQVTIQCDREIWAQVYYRSVYRSEGLAQCQWPYLELVVDGHGRHLAAQGVEQVAVAWVARRRNGDHVTTEPRSDMKGHVSVH